VATTTAARPRARAPGRQAGTSLQGGRASYYSQGGARTATIQGGSGTHKIGTQGRQVRYQSPSGQQVAGTVPAVPAKTYHRIVLAEFAVCIVLIAASPVLTPRTKASGATVAVDATASLAGPLVRLTAVCVVFFVLALMATGPKAGKVAAAFGGLVVAGTALNATDMFTALGHAFTGTASASSWAAPGAATAAGQAAAGAFGGIAPTPTGIAPPPPLGATG
jgi:hypothetical protein